jgi:ATP-dependent DNA helicase RecQ
MLYQLIDSGLLERTSNDRPMLRLNDAAREVLRGARTVPLLRAKKTLKKTRFEQEPFRDADRGLFDALRHLRRRLAAERKIPAYVVFSDATLREMARVRPSSPTRLLEIHGVGERKLADIGGRFLEAIASYCRENRLPLDSQ